MKNKLNKSKSIKEDKQSEGEEEEREDRRRTWVGVSNKVSKKDMEKIDVSKDKGGEIDVNRAR